MEEIRLFTLRELKKEIEENLEYAHPQRDTNPGFRVAFGISYGFKPIVNEIFFDSENEAVDYTFQTNEMYKNIQECDDNTKIIEYYDEKRDTSSYELYNTNSVTVPYKIFSPKWNQAIEYEFVMTKEVFLLNHAQVQTITCKSLDDGDCAWTGALMMEDALAYDDIIYPQNIRYLFEHLWISWKNDKIESDQVEKEIIALMQWLDAMTRTKPSSAFWNQ